VQEIDGISEQAAASNVSRISRFESATGFDLSESSEESNDVPPILK